MYRFCLFFILIITLSCDSKKSDVQIDKFEETLGKNKVEALDLLVVDFEKNLKKIYPDLSTNNAYHQYLKDIISDSASNSNKFSFQSQKTNTQFHESGLWDEIYIADSINGIDLNITGLYMKAIYNVIDSDTLIKKYYNKRNAAGIIPNILFTPGILSSTPNFNNYFHKRIVVIEFSY